MGFLIGAFLVVLGALFLIAAYKGTQSQVFSFLTGKR